MPACHAWAYARAAVRWPSRARAVSGSAWLPSLLVCALIHLGWAIVISHILPNLSCILPNLGNSNSGRDLALWRSANRIFSVKSAYRFINDGRCRLRHANIILTIQCPLKIKVFIWLLIKNVILTWYNLQRHGWIESSIYAFMWTCRGVHWPHYVEMWLRPTHIGAMHVFFATYNRRLFHLGARL